MPCGRVRDSRNSTGLSPGSFPFARNGKGDLGGDRNPLSPFVGEKAGRPEGGVIARNIQFPMPDTEHPALLGKRGRVEPARGAAMARGGGHHHYGIIG